MPFEQPISTSSSSGRRGTSGDRARRPKSGGPEEVDSLATAARVLRRRWWLVLLVALLATAATIAYSSTRDEVYESGASVLFGQAQLSDSTFGVQRNSAEPEREAATQVLVATSSEVTNRARNALRGRAPTENLESRITVEAAANANILSFKASGATPQEAAAVANAFALGYLDFSRQSETDQLDAQIQSVESRVSTTPIGPGRDTLEQQLNSLRTLKSVARGQARLIGSAGPKSEPVSPKPRRDAVIGAILGLALGVGLVFLLDAADRRVLSENAFERLYGLQVLAAIPRVAFSPRNRRDRVIGFEPYRVLRNTIGYLELNSQLDVILVTSAVRAEGKSTVAVNLARAMALNGQRVVLVECDLRRPSLVRDLGLQPPEGGLTTALAHNYPVSELLLGFDPELPNLLLLPAGPLPPNAAELLRSPSLDAILVELKASGVQVIIDAPPLLSVADAQGLLDHPQVDGALLVARMLHTTQDEARRTRAILDQHHLEPLGLVITGVQPEEAYGTEGVDPKAGALMPVETSGGVA